MLDAGERAYAYAKACGIIGKSFVGKRIRELAALRTLTELDRLVFPNERHELPGRELLVDLESRIIKRAIRNIIAVINSYHKPPQALIRQLRSFEYADLKTCLHYISDGKSALPPLSDIGSFRTIRYEFFPDLKLMLAGTEFDFLPAKMPAKLSGSNVDLTVLETELDLHYYRLMKESLSELSAEDRVMADRILWEEISLRNCVWALRLRSYFKMTAAETEKHLMDIKTRNLSGGAVFTAVPPEKARGGKKEISLAADAVESLDKPLDQRSAWKGWKWEALLNPEKSDHIWEADPGYFQNSASYYLYRLALSGFHRSPFAVSAVFCFIKLKQFEEDLLTSISEGLSLGMSPPDVFSLLEVSV